MTGSSIEIRRRLLALIREFPGLHLRELARQAGLSEALANYHLNAIEAEEMVSSEQEAGFRRFYPGQGPAPSERDRDLMALLRQRAPLQIVLLLLERPHASHQELTAELDLAKSTVTYHLKKLEAEGVVVASPDRRRFALVEPKRVTRLLLRWEPPEDLTDRFSKLWQGFYRRRGRQM